MNQKKNGTKKKKDSNNGIYNFITRKYNGLFETENESLLVGM